MLDNETAPSAPRTKADIPRENGANLHGPVTTEGKARAQMLHEECGLGTAQILLHASKVSEGYVALWERKRLDLTVEALILGKNGASCSAVPLRRTTAKILRRSAARSPTADIASAHL